MYAHIPIGLRSVREMLQLLNEWVPGLIEDMPSHVTIAEWCHKAGLETYIEAPERVRASGSHARIIDESITIGRQKVLVQLAVPINNPGHALRHEDTEVVGISVAPSWKGEDVRTEIDATTQKIGQAPDYITSDGGRNLLKGITLTGITHHLDIAHTTGNIIKDVYANDADFKEFTSLLESIRLKVQLTENAFLQPPKQRSIARFMNLFSWVDWADHIIEVLPILSNDARQIYAPVLKYQNLVAELKLVTGTLRRMEQLCKENGLSQDISNLLQKEIAGKLITQNTPNRVRIVACGLVKYLISESRQLPDEHARHNVSSDIIESAFGDFKFKSSHNKNCGVTIQIMMMPLATKLKTKRGRNEFDYVHAVRAVRRADLKDWCDMKLDENMMTRRRNMLQKASGF